MGKTLSVAFSGITNCDGCYVGVGLTSRKYTTLISPNGAFSLTWDGVDAYTLTIPNALQVDDYVGVSCSGIPTLTTLVDRIINVTCDSGSGNYTILSTSGTLGVKFEGSGADLFTTGVSSILTMCDPFTSLPSVGGFGGTVTASW